MSDTKWIKAIHDLVATCNDAAEGFGKAAKGVHDDDLSNWLAAAADERLDFAQNLSRALSEMGEQPVHDLHEGGILRKGWVDLEQRLRSTAEHLHSKDDSEIIREVIAGDSNTLPHYDNALAQNLPPDIRAVIIGQRAAISDGQLALEAKLNPHESRAATSKA